MTKQEVIEILAIPAKEVNERLGINPKSLISLVIANTHWLAFDKPFFNFNCKGEYRKPKYTSADVLGIYDNFVDSFTEFNERKLMPCREMKKYWKNRGRFDMFIYSLENCGLIENWAKKKAMAVGNEYEDIFEKFLKDEE